jgi:hypothetical protein
VEPGDCMTPSSDVSRVRAIFPMRFSFSSGL